MALVASHYFVALFNRVVVEIAKNKQSEKNAKSLIYSMLVYFLFQILVIILQVATCLR